MKKIRLYSLLMMMAMVALLLTLQGPGVAFSAPGGITPTPIEETEPPVTEPPVTQPPVTEPPVTQPPVTQPPVTQPPVTQPPVTQPPVTQPPVTQPPAATPMVQVTVVSDSGPTLPGTGGVGLSRFEELFAGRPLRLPIAGAWWGLLFGAVGVCLPRRWSLPVKLTLALPLVALAVFGTGWSQAQGAAASRLAALPAGITDSSAVERIVIPALKLDAAVERAAFDGQSWTVAGLGSAVGWLDTTSIPGQGGNTVLAGHLTQSQTTIGPFRRLLFLQAGEKIEVYTAERVYTYMLREQYLTRPTNLAPVAPSDTPRLTLVTCAEWDAKAGLYRTRRVAVADLIQVRSLPPLLP
jgi:LPXTG-site transpeptidase (sortase) family protein